MHQPDNNMIHTRMTNKDNQMTTNDYYTWITQYFKGRIPWVGRMPLDSRNRTMGSKGVMCERCNSLGSKRGNSRVWNQEAPNSSKGNYSESEDEVVELGRHCNSKRCESFVYMTS
jgi:hypothetical protein